MTINVGSLLIDRGKFVFFWERGGELRRENLAARSTTKPRSNKSAKTAPFIA